MAQLGMGNIGSPMSVIDTSSNSSLDLAEETKDKLDSDYDPLWDLGGCVVPFL